MRRYRRCIAFAGRQDNAATREAALAALGLNFLLAIASLVTIAKTIPKHSTEKDGD